MKNLFAASLLTFVATAAAAETVTYACQLKGKGYGYIADEMVIGVNNETGQAVIADPIIMWSEEQPIRTKVSQSSAKKQSFNWELALTSSTGQTTKMKYRAALQFPSMRLTVYATPSGYSNRFRMQGNCAVTDQKLPGLG